jgi:hypothetical protein
VPLIEVTKLAEEELVTQVTLVVETPELAEDLTTEIVEVTKEPLVDMAVRADELTINAELELLHESTEDKVCVEEVDTSHGTDGSLLSPWVFQCLIVCAWRVYLLID